MDVDRGFRFASCAALLLFAASSGATRVRAQAAPSGVTVIKQVEVGTQQGAPIVEISGDGALAVHVARLTAPDRLVLDFSNARVGAVHPAAAPIGPVRGLRVGQFKPDVARVVVNLDSPAPFQIESSDGRVTVSFENAAASAPPADRVPQRSSAQSFPQPAVGGAALMAAKGSPSRPALKPAVASSPAPTAMSSAPAAPFQPAMAAQPPAAMEVNSANSFQNGLLTFTAKDRPLELVLDDIGGMTNLPIVLADGVGGSEHISVQFRSFRLDEALRQILKNYDFILSYSGNEGDSGDLTLHTVWVYPANQGPGMARFAMAAWKAKAREYEQASASSDPDERARAVDELIRRDGRGAVSTLMDALKDPSDKVRYQALYRAVLVGALPPEDTIIDLVLNDSSEQVKVWAFQTLPLDPTLRWVALRASNDSNQQLAALGRNYLSDLDASLGAPPGTSAAAAVAETADTTTPPSPAPRPAVSTTPAFPSATTDPPPGPARHPVTPAEPQ